jgi:two-component system chemotaxis response regulator CheB
MARSRAGIPFDVVVIGASAGGVQALGQLLPRLPASFAPAMVIALHQPADSSGVLAEMFDAKCALPVRLADDKQPLAGGTVLFAPPGYHTLIEGDSAIALSLEPPEHFSRPSIDALFESAAWGFRDRALGILLTGASADGAAGLLLIQQAGGAAWVQDPATAAADLMPRSALDLGVRAQVLSLEQMSLRLARMAARHSDVTLSGDVRNDKENN